MSRPKKTFKIADFVDSCNFKLELVTISQEEKSAICTLLEELLMSTDQYAGFNYVTTLWVKPALHREAVKFYKSIPDMTEEERTEFYKEQEFSRHYYVKSR